MLANKVKYLRDHLGAVVCVCKLINPLCERMWCMCLDICTGRCFHQGIVSLLKVIILKAISLPVLSGWPTTYFFVCMLHSAVLKVNRFINTLHIMHTTLKRIAFANK